MKIVKETLDENFLQSPLPFIQKLRKWLYGKESPKVYVKVIYGITTTVGFLFFVWHMLGFAAVFLRKFVFAKKQIAVDEVVGVNAKKLGYSFEELIRYLHIHHVVSIFIWFLILWVLIFFWRGKKQTYLYLLFLLFAYFLQGIYFFGWRFITYELSLFDWLLFILFSVSLFVGASIQLFFTKPDIQKENKDLSQ